LAHSEERDRPLLFLASVSGLRFGELAGLQGGDVHPRACRISVNRAVIELDGHQEIKPYPKGGSDSRREIGVPASVIELLLPLLRGREESDWLFTNRTGGPLFYKATRRRLVAALDAAVSRAAGCTCCGARPRRSASSRAPVSETCRTSSATQART